MPRSASAVVGLLPERGWELAAPAASAEPDCPDAAASVVVRDVVASAAARTVWAGCRIEVAARQPSVALSPASAGRPVAVFDRRDGRRRRRCCRAAAGGEDTGAAATGGGAGMACAAFCPESR